MRQVVQSVRDGRLRVADVPRPSIGPTEVLIAPTHSVISSGTERAARRLASAGLVAKARARPDLARRVVRRARTDGIARTVRSVRARLDEDMPLGYSSAGRVVEVGEWVSGLTAGDLVAAAGAGHAELQVVPATLAVPLPPGVDPAAGAFAALGAIALNGLRLAEVGPGARVCVIGLGLIGRLTARVARAAGCEVAGLDVSAAAVEDGEPALDLALVDEGDVTTKAVVDWARGRGVDAVLITAASSDAGPLVRAPELARDRATVVVVGDVPIEASRAALYEKQLDLRVARSYGPGRYDPVYEEWGVEYPSGEVPWTARRNLESIVDLMASGALAVGDLVDRQIPFAEAESAYALVADPARPRGAIQLVYPDAPSAAPAAAPAARRPGRPTVALLGAGTYARATLGPALGDAGFDVRLVASASGVSAANLAARLGATAVEPDAALAADDVDVVALATPHDTHAGLAAAALRAGKHVFCEKPLAIDEDGLAALTTAWRETDLQLGAGFNRRHSEAVAVVRDHVAGRGGPVVITYRVAAEPTPPGHFYADRRQGGRLLGEVCHFVDTCAAIVGHDATGVTATASGRSDELLLAEDLVVTLRYPDGSLATVAYSTGAAPGTAKERVEVLGGGRTAVIEDFHRVELDGRRRRLSRPGKGHVELLGAFREAVTTGEPFPTDAAIATTAATLAAAASLTTGAAADPASFAPGP